RRTLIVVPLVGLATVVVTAATTSGSHAHLPVPKTVPISAAHKAGAGKPTHAGTGAEVPPPSPFAIPPPPPLSGCTVSVSNPSPTKGQTAETAAVTTTPGAHVRLQAFYSRTSTHGGLASSAGTVAFPLPISHVPVGMTVRVVATASLRGVQRSCSTSFTPVL
ncbi:MAG: hypothetical protein ACRDU0_02615, partial [Mycobacterium sp.]